MSQSLGDVTVSVDLLSAGREELRVDRVGSTKDALLALPLCLLAASTAAKEDQPLQVTLSFKPVVLNFPTRTELMQVTELLDAYHLGSEARSSASADAETGIPTSISAKDYSKASASSLRDSSLTEATTVMESSGRSSVSCSATLTYSTTTGPMAAASATGMPSDTKEDDMALLKEQIKAETKSIDRVASMPQDGDDIQKLISPTTEVASLPADTRTTREAAKEREQQLRQPSQPILLPSPQLTTTTSITAEILQDIAPMPTQQRAASSTPGAFPRLGRVSNSGEQPLPPGRITQQQQDDERSITDLAALQDNDDQGSDCASQAGSDDNSTLQNSHHSNFSGLSNFSEFAPLEARLVDGADDEEGDQLSQATGDVVEAKPLEVVLSNRTAACAVIMVATLFVGLLVGFLVARDDNDGSNIPPSMMPSWSPSLSPSASPSFRDITTLERVKERGILRCGAYQLHWGHQGPVFNSSQTIDGQLADDASADVRMCRGIGAAVFGKSSYRIQMIPLELEGGLESLKNREVDVVLSHPTPTMATDIYDSATETGYTLSASYAFDGLAFGGLPFYAACADDNMKSFFECNDLKICVYGGSSYYDLIGERVPGRNILTTNSTTETYMGFIEGKCNVMAMESTSLAEIFIRVLIGYTGDYAVGNNKFTKVFYSSLTLDSDPEWSDFVNMLVLAGFAAEARSITAANASLFGSTAAFGLDHTEMFIDAISVSGNFENLYDLYRDYTTFLDSIFGPGNDAMYDGYESSAPRTGWNLLNDGTTGLITAPVIEENETMQEGPGPEPGGTLSRILTSGKVVCGVRPGRPGFADFVQTNNDTASLDLTGIDVDYCRAISAGIWDGDPNLVEFVEVIDQAAGFVALSEGTIDLFAGATWSLLNDVNEPTTGDGFTFSQPYFYRPLGSPAGDEAFDDNLCLATREDDPQWSSFVYWSAISLVVAEDRGITQRLSSHMPEVLLFGPQFARMFKDVVHSVGNHGQIYDRCVGGYVPRDGRNKLNLIRDGNPQLYVLPGFDGLSLN